MKYTINYGFGEATLYTPYDAKERFYALANTCFGIRKSIMHCVILKAEDIPCEDFERLEFNGDVYVWREDGARKMVAPLWAADKEWDMDYCEMVRSEAPAPAQTEEAPAGKAPEGYHANPLFIENKSKRLQLLTKPSTAEKLRAKAQREGRSVNDIVNTILEEALREE